jgi:hypothetical protein
MGYAWVRQGDGFLVQRQGGVFRAFGWLGFRRLKIINPEEAAAGNHWTRGLTIVTALLFTKKTQFSC